MNFFKKSLLGEPSHDPVRRRLFKSSLLAALALPAASGLRGEERGQGSRHVWGGAGTDIFGTGTASPKQSATFYNTFEEIKRTATDEELYRFLYAMPKGGDIHHHLGGGILPYMWLEVATDQKRNGGQRFFTRYRVTTMQRHPLISQPGVSFIYTWINLREESYLQLPRDLQSDFKPLDELTDSEKEAWESSVVLDEKGEGRNEFFEYHWPRLGQILTSIHVMTELFVENMKLFAAEGVTYLEIQRMPYGARDEKGELLSPQESDQFWKNRLAQKDAVDTGVHVRWQAIVVRFLPNAEELVRMFFAHIDSNREDWVGINMAGREDDNRGYPARFTAVYDEMLRKYPDIGISIHAGEAEKGDSYIFDTLRLGATRIGHGINLIQDPQTFQMMRGTEHLIEINLISNELLQYVPNLDLHPFPIYLRQGISCCLNTDDRGMWDSNYTDELFVGVKRFNLSWSEINKMARDSFQKSFAQQDLKNTLLSDYEAKIAAIESKVTSKNWKSLTSQVNAVTHGYGKKTLGLAL